MGIKIKKIIKKIRLKRTTVLVIVFVFLSSVLVRQLFSLQIIQGEDYISKFQTRTTKTRVIKSTRGNIYDRNGTVVASNVLAYSVTFEDSGTYNSTREKNLTLNGIAYQVLQILSKNGDSLSDNFHITVNDHGDYAFDVDEGFTLNRFRADVYGEAQIDNLSDEQKNATAAQMMDYLTGSNGFSIVLYGKDAYTSEELAAHSLPEELTKQEILEIAIMRYQLNTNSFKKYMPVTIATNVSEKSVAAIRENQSALQGIDIVEDSTRKYVEDESMAPILGYTGQASSEELENLRKDNPDYSNDAIVGKAGIEQYMELDLQGKDGEETVTVDNLGKVLDIDNSKTVDPVAGNDVYLTIDKNLQESTYKLLEEKIAGIVLSKLQNVLEYDTSSVDDSKNLIIPVSDAYYNLIGNAVIDSGHFSSSDAKTAEQQVYSIFQGKKTETISLLESELQNSQASAYTDLSNEMKAYMDYICDTLLTKDTGILMSDQIDKNDATYIAWAKDETINLYTYLNYAISKNWIDTSKLGSSSYSSSEEIYQEILKYLKEYLADDSNFDKLLYKYLIKSGSVTGEQVCAIVYEQGVLPMDDSTYNGLLNGETNAFSWIKSKLESLELTPGELALEPCSAGAVVTNPNTGEVLACVSYPGYDNNRLSNVMDRPYYVQLSMGMSRTFYNRATQEKTAPGSTYKMLSSVAGLTEGVINGNSYISCSGVFDKITPSPKCWIYPSAHGSLNVVGALQHSCNDFFYEVGYRLGQDSNGNYDSDTGLEKLAKYAKMFGFDQTSGIEIPESQPQISDSDSVRSAIGQGTNNYTVSQINRYVTAVANRGTVYSLSLIDKTTDSNGKLIKDYTPEVVNQMDEISSSTWDLVHNGMESMVKSSSTFAGMDISMGGKTGTAQYSKIHADNVLFVGYAPADSPEISIAVRIANGYASTYAAEIGRDITKVYFNPESADELLQGYASSLGTAEAGD